MGKKCFLFLASILFLTACGTPKTEKQAASEAASKSAQVNTRTSSPKKSGSTDSKVSQKGSRNSQDEDKKSRDFSTDKDVANDSKSSPESPVEKEVPKINEESPKTSKKKILPVQGQFQRQWNTCVPTVVSMMLSYFGKEVSQEELAIEMGTDEAFGTHNSIAIEVLNRRLFGYGSPGVGQAGYRLAEVRQLDAATMDLFADRFVKDIDDGYPVYLTVNNAVLYPGVSKGEHNLAGVGYELDGDGNLAFVYYLDPNPYLKDAYYGGLKKASVQELLKAMQACEEPNYGW